MSNDVPDRSASAPEPARGPSGLWNRIKRALASTEELESQELTQRAVAAGATLIAEARMRTKVVLQGTLVSLTVSPRGDTRWLEGEVRDGSGTVRLIWMGRHMIAGLEVGQTLRVRGLLTQVDSDRAIYNPEYELIP